MTGMLIDLISCSHFLVATVFMNACRNIWWLSIERQQNIAQLVVKTCRNHYSAVRKIIRYCLTHQHPFSTSGPPFYITFHDSAVPSRCISGFLSGHVDPNIILASLKLMNCSLHVQVQIWYDIYVLFEYWEY